MGLVGGVVSMGLVGGSGVNGISRGEWCQWD